MQTVEDKIIMVYIFALWTSDMQKFVLFSLKFWTETNWKYHVLAILVIKTFHIDFWFVDLIWFVDFLNQHIQQSHSSMCESEQLTVQKVKTIYTMVKEITQQYYWAHMQVDCGVR